MPQANAINFYSPAKWVVSKVAGEGTHTTIASALTSASTGDTIVIMPGVYTENITLKNGVNLSGFVFIGGSGERTQIVGKLIDNGVALGSTLTNIALQTNSDNILALTASGTTVLLEGCYVQCLNNTGIAVSSGAAAELLNCTGDLGTTGIGYCTGAGTTFFSNCAMLNSGSSLTASTTSGGIGIFTSTFSSCFSTSSGGTISLTSSVVDTSLINTTSITTAGTGTSKIKSSTIQSGTASAISIGTGTTLECYKTTINSTNTNPVTGAGTFKSDAVTYSNTGIIPNTSTRTFAIVGETNTFTPTLAFGGGSTGITYAGQTGSYTRIGNIVTFTLSLVLTNKGSSTGAAIISGLPYNAASTCICAISASSLTFVGMVSCRVLGDSTIALDSYATTATRVQLTDTAFVNSTFVQITGSYLV